MQGESYLKSKLGVRNIDGYNTHLEARQGRTLSAPLHTGYDGIGEAIYEKELEDPLPYIVASSTRWPT